jgi:hypothetical protein
MECLSKHISQLFRGLHLDQAHHAVLNGFVSEMLADINVLGQFPSDHVVPQLDTCGVQLS